MEVCCSACPFPAWPARPVALAWAASCPLSYGMALLPSSQSVQTFGRKKSAVAVSHCKKGRGLIQINGCPIDLVEPELLRYKVFEPLLLLGQERMAIMDMRIRVKGGGFTSQIYGAQNMPPLVCPLALWLATRR